MNYIRLICEITLLLCIENYKNYFFGFFYIISYLLLLGSIVYRDLYRFIKFLEIFYEVSDSYKEFYDFYIFYDFIPENLPEKFIVISENADIPNIEKISGEVTLPQSINIVSENDLLEYEIIYSNKLPINKKLDIIKNMGEYSAIYCTSDIYKVL